MDVNDDMDSRKKRPYHQSPPLLDKTTILPEARSHYMEVKFEILSLRSYILFISLMLFIEKIGITYGASKERCEWDFQVLRVWFLNQHVRQFSSALHYSY